MRRHKILGVSLITTLLLGAWGAPRMIPSIVDLLTAPITAQNPATAVLYNATITTDGGQAVVGFVGGEADLLINVGGLDGGSITFSLADADPQNPTTSVTGGTSATTAAIIAAGTSVLTGVPVHSSALNISWTITPPVTASSVFVTLAQKQPSPEDPGGPVTAPYFNATTGISSFLGGSYGLELNAIGKPAAPTVSPVTTGFTTVAYCVAALPFPETLNVIENGQGNLGETLCSTATQITNSNATLNNTITWVIQPGAAVYDIYRTVGGANQGLISRNTTGTSYTDANVSANTNVTANTTNDSSGLVCLNVSAGVCAQVLGFDNEFELTGSLALKGGELDAYDFIAFATSGNQAFGMKQGSTFCYDQYTCSKYISSNGTTLALTGLGYSTPSITVGSGSSVSNVCVAAQGGCSMASTTTCTVACTACTTSSVCFCSPYSNAGTTDAVGTAAACSSGTVTITAKAGTTGTETFNCWCAN